MIKVSNKDLIISYLSYFMKFGASLLLTPLVVFFLPEQELGLWYTFASVAYIIDLMDLGFNPNLVRNLTFAWSGATTLIKEGVPEKYHEDGSPNLLLFGIVFNTCKVLRMIMAGLSLLVMLSIGTVYINHTMKNFPETNYMIPWVLYSFAIGSGYFFGHWSSALRGIGRIAEGQQAVLIGKVAHLIMSAIFLFSGMGLTGLCLSYLFSALVERSLARYSFLKYGLDKEKLKKYTKGCSRKEFFATLSTVWHNAKKSAINSIATAVISQIGVLLCSGFLGVVTTAAYGLCNQIFTTTIAMGRISNNIFIPKYSDLRLHRKRDELKKYYSMAEVVYWSICIVVMIAACTIGIPLIQWIKPGIMLEIPMLLLIGITYYLEGESEMNMNVISSANSIPFVKASVITSVMVVLANYVFLRFTAFGIYGIILSKLLVQAVYMDWKWVYVVHKDLDLNYAQITKIGLKAGIGFILKKQINVHDKEEKK